MIEDVIREQLIGESRIMRRLRSDIVRLARSDLPVLVQGPTGSGKEVVAQAIHRVSGRAGGIVAFNVCAISESMFEDTLFGHVRGAFTGAVADVPGYLVEAHGGTLFLDEISGLPALAQAKLLRVLETKEFRPVGGRSNRCSDFRPVAATNVELLDEVEAGRFRADLAYRLSGDVLIVPSLDERREDIAALAEHFLGQLSRELRRTFQISSDALSLLAAVEWPGNVRELRHALRRAAAHSARSVIGRAEMTQSLQRATRQRVVPVDDPRRQELLDLLESFAWDVERVAHRMEVHPVTVYRRMKQFALRRPALGGRTFDVEQRRALGS